MRNMNETKTNNNNFVHGYIQLRYEAPMAIICNKNLTSTEKVVFTIVNSAFGSNPALIHIKQMSNSVNTYPKTIKRALFHLAKLGWIGINIDGKNIWITDINQKRALEIGIGIDNYMTNKNLP